MSTLYKFLATLLFLAVSFGLSRPLAAQFPPAPGTGPGLAETIEAIDAARVTTRILYITAHPDDESAAVLTYLARGLHADVALLSLTHGEGGQNALGPEQAPQLGLIRTQELLAATRGYGVKLYFTRAKDFGFSKTPEETQKIWGDQVLEDMVRIIREFRPNIVINNWGGVHTGHGHHQAAGILTPQAVQLAADKSFKINGKCESCPEVSPWGGTGKPVTILDLERGSDNPSGYIVPLDDVSLLWGKTWREIGLDAFVNHRTQGISAFINSPFLRRPIALRREDGKTFDPQELSVPLKRAYEKSLSTSGCPLPEHFSEDLSSIEEQLASARAQSLLLNWRQAAVAVVKATELFHGLDPFHEATPCRDSAVIATFQSEVQKLEKALKLVAGIEVNGFADRSNIARGDGFQVSVSMRCRPGLDCSPAPLPELSLPFGMKELHRKEVSPGNLLFSVEVEKDVRVTGWLNGEADDYPLVSVADWVTVANYAFKVSEPVVHIDATSTSAIRLPLRLVPAYSVSVEPSQKIFALPSNPKPFDVFLRIHSYTSVKEILQVVSADVPYDWQVKPAGPVSFSGPGDQYVRLTVTPPANLPYGDYELKPYARRDLPATKVMPSDAFNTSLESLPTMPSLLWPEETKCEVHAFPINVPDHLHVGYVSAENEPIPQALRDLGIQVDLLDANAVNFGDLSKFNAIVVGIRAYEIRTDLPGANQRLLDYVQNGGTLLVQYERDFAWNKAPFAPYPATIENDAAHSLSRITDENAEVKFLKPDDPLLNTPNKITQDDFKNWIQERGLYYWTTFDDKYTPLLSMHDPNEKDLTGGLVYTHLGKGTYIYTGLAFFRQLPEGVPGAYRLFVNLLSASSAR